MDRYLVVFLDVVASAAPLQDGEPVPRPARMVTVEGDAPGPYAAALRAWDWLAAAEAPRATYPGAYCIYSEPKLIASPDVSQEPVRHPTPVAVVRPGSRQG